MAGPAQLLWILLSSFAARGHQARKLQITGQDCTKMRRYPVGGNTWFANMRRAYEALPEKTRQRIDDLQAVHAYRESRDALTAKQRAEKVASGKGAQDGTVHPIVRTHDETAAKAIYINPLRLERFVGLGPEESTALVEELIAHATSAPFTYAHSWRQGDVIIWDNRQAMHRVEHNYDLAEIRLMHRIILKGQRPI
jgi:alpha-ketoglutarate-dependent taurine dioxygenase